MKHTIWILQITKTAKTDMLVGIRSTLEKARELAQKEADSQQANLAIKIVRYGRKNELSEYQIVTLDELISKCIKEAKNFEELIQFKPQKKNATQDQIE